jgi:hypothetical protein
VRTPKAGSRTYSFLKLLHDQGPQSKDALLHRFPSLSYRVLQATASEYQVKCVDGIYTLPENLSKWFADGTITPKPLGPIPTHTPRTFTPLKGYDASMRAGRDLRDVSFLSASGAASLVWRD